MLAGELVKLPWRHVFAFPRFGIAFAAGGSPRYHSENGDQEHEDTEEQVRRADPVLGCAAAQLARAKAASLRALAEHIVSGRLDLERLHELPDEDVVAQLVAVKGIGTWTADMFLIFHLHRPDVLPAGDVGLRRAVETAYGLDSRPGPAELQRIAESWRPHRTLACLYLWRMADAMPQV